MYATFTREDKNHFETCWQSRMKCAAQYRILGSLTPVQERRNRYFYEARRNVAAATHFRQILTDHKDRT